MIELLRKLGIRKDVWRSSSYLFDDIIRRSELLGFWTLSIVLVSRVPDDEQKSKNPVILSFMQHRRNPLESTDIIPVYSSQTQQKFKGNLPGKLVSDTML
jgi:uncharacterized membrane protein YdbT with pleckstrin-like domain